MNVGQRKLSRLDQMGHHRLRFAPEHGEKVVDQTTAGRISFDRRLEDIRGSDLLGASKRPFGLQAIYSGLDRCICGPFF